MKLNQIDIELIDQYLRNEMDENERSAFEQRLAVEADLREELEEMRLMGEALRFDALEKKKKMLEEYEEKLEDRKYNHFGISWKWSIAATIALLITAWLIWPGQEKVINKNEQLFASYFEPLEIDESGVRSGEDGQQSGIDESAANFYIIGRYDEAAPALEEVYEVEGDTSRLLLAGIAYLGNGNADKAIEIFDRFGEWPMKMQDEVLWYKALGYLMRGEVVKTKAQISQISNPAKFKVEELIEELD